MVLTSIVNMVGENTFQLLSSYFPVTFRILCDWDNWRCLTDDVSIIFFRSDSLISYEDFCIMRTWKIYVLFLWYIYLCSISVPSYFKINVKIEIRDHPQVKATILQLFDTLSSVFDTFKVYIDLKVTYTKIPAEKACK